MNDLAVNTLDNSITTSIATDYIQSVTDSYTGIYNPYMIPYDSCNYSNYTITTRSTKLETDSNELKINIKKFQIKFNFNL